MPHRDASNPTGIRWPHLSEGYRDEAGWIDAEVYNVAASLWPYAERLADQVIHDCEVGQRLMMGAVVNVSRKRLENRERLTNIRGYLFATFRHLLMEERAKRARRQEIDDRLVGETESIFKHPEGELNKVILLYELRERADDWTRDVLELVLLGHTFEEIANELKMKSNHVRSRFGKRIRKLSKQIQKETTAAEKVRQNIGIR
jgi:DNA-directed RNA polymerase specialized sigma24 family protein